jgi:flagellar motor switch/type III secretory pathway protein FliN
MEPQHFRLLGERERNALAQHVATAARDWAGQWLPRGSEVRTTCFTAAGREAPPAPGGWTRYAVREGGEWIGVALGDADTQALGAALFGAAPAPSAVACAAARVSALEFAARLLESAPQALREAADEPPSAVWQRGSAALAIEVSAAQCRLALVASPAWTLRRLGARVGRTLADVPLAALQDAARSARFQMHVVAGNARLALRELRALQVGDVLALRAPLDGALRVQLAGSNAAPLEARLGSLEGRRAVSLAVRNRQ